MPLLLTQQMTKIKFMLAALGFCFGLCLAPGLPSLRGSAVFNEEPPRRELVACSIPATRDARRMRTTQSIRKHLLSRNTQSHCEAGN
jgi:hypothetical protein